MTNRFDDLGYGARAIGFGARPAILVVDFQLAFTDPSLDTGRSPHIQRAVENTRVLLAPARRCNIPVAACWLAWSGERDMCHWKAAPCYDGRFFHGHPSTRLDSRIHDPGYDFSFSKVAPSIFFATPLITFLAKQCVDTVIVTGCTTSGCVRASIIDSFSHGFRTIVPEDCVGDMEEDAHRANLRDVARRYADVVTLQDALAYLERFSPALSG